MQHDHLCYPQHSCHRHNNILRCCHNCNFDVKVVLGLLELIVSIKVCLIISPLGWVSYKFHNDKIIEYYALRINCCYLSIN